MIHFFRKIKNNPFLTSSLIMLIGSNIYNGGQFAYHIFAARLLGNNAYGDVAALLNILGIFALIQTSLGMTVVKFVASQKDDAKIKGLVNWSLKIGLYFGLITAVLILILGESLNNFLRLSQHQAIYILAPVAFLYSLTSVSRSVLQGLLKFTGYVLTLIFEIGIKFILSVILILAGYSILGAMFGFLVGVAAAVVIGIWYTRDLIDRRVKYVPEIKPMLKYVVPAFLQGIALTSMYTTDLFLVKHFFQPEVAGTYAAVVKLGSIVFFAASPISNVMFPLVAKRHSHGEKYHHVFYLSLLLISLASLAIIVIYYLFPRELLGALGNSFSNGSALLWISGLYMGILALDSLIIQFYMSISKTFIVWLFISAAILQALLIYLYHSSLSEVLWMSVVSASLLLVALLIYYPYHDRNSKVV